MKRRSRSQAKGSSAHQRCHVIALMLMVCIAVGGICAVASCGRMPVYTHFEHIDHAGWSRTDTLRFAVPLPASHPCRMQLNLRADSSYPYTQLLMAVSSHSVSQPHMQYADTLTLSITDAEGNHQGTGISLRQYSVLLPTHSYTAADEADTLVIAVTHAMSRHLLPGITEVGITAE